MINFLFQKGAKSMWKNFPDKNGFSMTDFKLNPKTENGKIFAFYEEEKFTLLIASTIVFIINFIILYYGNGKSS